MEKRHYYGIDWLRVVACILVSAVMLIQAILIGYDNKCISFLSGISMEIYLSRMIIFRVIEKLHLNTVFGNGWLQYFVTVILVFTGAVCFSVVVKKALKIFENTLVRKV